MLDPLVQGLRSFLGPTNLMTVVRISAIVLVGLLVVRLVMFFVRKGMRTRFSPQSVMIVRKVVFYTGSATDAFPLTLAEGEKFTRTGS